MYPATNKEKREFVEKWKQIQKLGNEILSAVGHDIKIVPAEDYSKESLDDN